MDNPITPDSQQDSRIEVFHDRGPWTGLDAVDATHHFSFALISDRTGGAREGVFERGIAAINLVRPAFAVQMGDMIVGYTDDHEALEADWAEMDRILSPLEVPMMHVAGNHDVSTGVAPREHWIRRYGRTYFHFRYKDVLFIVLDTQDGPTPRSPILDELDDFAAWLEKDPQSAQYWGRNIMDWEGTQPVAMSPEQADDVIQALTDNDDVRWTFVFMHMPAWQGQRHPEIVRIMTALADRPHTAFSGHLHNYRHFDVGGRDYIRLASTGGEVVVPQSPDGNFDHITLVSVGDDAPTIVSFELDGIRDVSGRPVAPLT